MSSRVKRVVFEGLPGKIRKLYAVCDAETDRDCERCPFFELTDKEFECYCGEETLLEVLEGRVK